MQRNCARGANDRTVAVGCILKAIEELHRAESDAVSQVCHGSLAIAFAQLPSGRRSWPPTISFPRRRDEARDGGHGTRAR